jgi:hypothetical protein
MILPSCVVATRVKLYSALGQFFILSMSLELWFRSEKLIKRHSFICNYNNYFKLNPLYLEIKLFHITTSQARCDTVQCIN